MQRISILQSYMMILFSCLLIFFQADQCRGSFWDKLPFFSTTIAGIIIKDARYIGGSPIIVRKDTITSRKHILHKCFPNSRIVLPVMASVSIEDVTTDTDENGIFHIEKNSWGLTQKRLKINFTGSDKGVINIDIGKKGADATFLVLYISEKGMLDIYRLKDEDSLVKQKGLIFIHGSKYLDYIAKSETHMLSDWDKMIELFENDSSLKDRFIPLKFCYDANKKVTTLSKELSCAIVRYRFISGIKRPVDLIGFGFGSLIARHYTISNFYLEGSVERTILYAPPNHGYSFIMSTEKKSLEVSNDSDFLKALNNNSNPELLSRFMINSLLTDDHGLNSSVKYFVVAGDYASSIKSYLNEGTRGTRKIITFFERLFSNKSQQESHSAFNGLEKKLKKYIKSLPDGDLLVSLKSARLGEGVPFYVINHPHITITRPSDSEDIRFLLLRDIVLGRKD